MNSMLKLFLIKAMGPFRKTYMLKASLALCTGLLVAMGPAYASTIQVFGSGSAVTSVDASADFENTASLGVTYIENGMQFTRAGITTNNNGCGYAGCSGSFHPYGFVGNYFYGDGGGPGYIQIDALGGNDFYALEFIAGWGPSSHSFFWETYNDSVLVGSGAGTIGPGTVLGFNNSSGFDVLRYTDVPGTAGISTILPSNPAPGIDNVRAQWQPTPEPASIVLLGLGLAGLGFSRRKKQKAA